MADPPYPRATTQTGIGQYAIGVTPIGDVPSFDVWATMMSQYANSPTLTAMITAFNNAMDFTDNMNSFYDMIWNILTAQGYGLDVWGRIVGVTRNLTIPATTQFFGFVEGSSWTGFGQGGFASPGALLSQNYILGDTDYRRLILAKAATNISDGSIPSTNAIMLALFFGRGTCYVSDGLNMQLAYIFDFALTPPEAAIVAFPGVLPAATGTVINVVQNI